jgi:hypothetical protein
MRGYWENKGIIMDKWENSGQTKEKWDWEKWDWKKRKIRENGKMENFFVVEAFCYSFHIYLPEWQIDVQ